MIPLNLFRIRSAKNETIRLTFTYWMCRLALVACIALTTGCASSKISSLTGDHDSIDAILFRSENQNQQGASRRDARAKTYTLHSTAQGEISTTVARRSQRLSFQLPNTGITDPNACLYIKDEQDQLVQIQGGRNKFFFTHSKLNEYRQTFREVETLRKEIAVQGRIIEEKTEELARVSSWLRTSQTLSSTYQCRAPSPRSLSQKPPLACNPRQAENQATVMCGVAWLGRETCGAILSDVGSLLGPEISGFLRGAACKAMVEELLGQDYTQEEVLGAAILGLAGGLANRLWQSDDLGNNLIGMLLQGYVLVEKARRFSACTERAQKVCIETYSNYQEAVRLYNIDEGVTLVRRCETKKSQFIGARNTIEESTRRRDALRTRLAEAERQLNRSSDLKRETCSRPPNPKEYNPRWTRMRIATVSVVYPFAGASTATGEESSEAWSQSGGTVPLSGRLTVRLSRYPSLYLVGTYNRFGQFRLADNDDLRASIGDPVVETEYFGAGLGYYKGLGINGGVYVEGGVGFGDDTVTLQNPESLGLEFEPVVKSPAVKPFIEVGAVIGRRIKGRVGFGYVINNLGLEEQPPEQEILLPDDALFLNLGLQLDIF